MNPRVAHKLMSVISELEQTSGKGMPDDVKSAVDSLKSAVSTSLQSKSSSYDTGESGSDDEKSGDQGDQPSFGSAKEKTLARFQKSRKDNSGDDPQSDS